MARLRRPPLSTGSINDLVSELHALHARAGLPSTRILARGQRFTYTTVHEVFTKTSTEPPKLPVLLRIVDQLAQLAPRTDVQETLDRFDQLWRAADEEATSLRFGDIRSVVADDAACAESGPTVAWRLDSAAPGGGVTPQLRKAIGFGELHLAYQPIYDRAGAISRIEAYVRCRMPDGSIARGDTLIPAVRQAGVLAELDLWVLRAAAVEAADWPAANSRAPRLTVNLSAHICLSELFAETIVDVVLSSGLALSRLSIDIEDSAVRRLSLVKLGKLSYLTSRRMELAIDDFGRGYESIAALRGLPVQAIKIDDSVVRRITTDATDLVIARAMTDMAAAMEIETIATGIESAEQLDLLRSIGVRGYQGYLFGRPMSSSELLGILRN
jgi:EAL domain-containing protein (putative c-di-GMP-specific phosphodiesterase class I)